jgi:hypothetical protein
MRIITKVFGELDQLRNEERVTVKRTGSADAPHVNRNAVTRTQKSET